MDSKLYLFNYCKNILRFRTYRFRMMYFGLHMNDYVKIDKWTILEALKVLDF